MLQLIVSFKLPFTDSGNGNSSPIRSPLQAVISFFSLAFTVGSLLAFLSFKYKLIKILFPGLGLFDDSASFA